MNIKYLKFFLFIINAAFWLQSCSGLKDEKKLIVATFNLERIKGGPNLTKIQYIDQYYLAENLGLPPMTDWAPSAISQGFVKKWDFQHSRKLFLELRQDLKWSDGSVITAEEMFQHLQNLRENPGIHLPSLKKLKHLSLSQNRVTLVFDEAVPDVLEELCRADAVLHSGSWEKTSGPFYLAETTEDRVILKANPYFPADLLKGVSPPQTIIFRSVTDDSSLIQGFADNLFHFHYSLGAGLFKKMSELQKHRVHVYWSTPMVIYFFNFNPSLSGSERKALAVLFTQARQAIRHSTALNPEIQLIPNGYPSALNEFQKQKVLELGKDAKALRALCKKNKKYIVKMSEAMNDVVLISDSTLQKFLNKALDRLNCPAIEVQILTRPQYKEELKLRQYDAFLESFTGNSRYANGSWSFLTSFRPSFFISPEGAHQIQKAQESLDPKTRAQLFQDAHFTFLKNADVVPLFVTSNAFFHSSDLDVSRVNPLDLRLRFWMMQWKR